MELTVLKALAWRINSITPFSYIHILTQKIDANETLVDELTRRTTELLVTALLDPEFLEFKHCVMATSAIRSAVENLLPSKKIAPLANMEAFILQDHQDDLIKCRKMLAKLMVQDHERFVRAKNYWHGPLSPVTVLKVDHFGFQKWPVDISFRRMHEMNVVLKSGRKRKREELGLWDVN
ncbi:Unknown protein [Striga hermonthica]|uniref:Cyclin C-terminal domain-containing protein n=1 Tax=Striga hermonthica TaxID=68872 RepID=A0A9N7NUK1_STRHE|nr:Unknown protein [Striga hermonthica]